MIRLLAVCLACLLAACAPFVNGEIGMLLPSSEKKKDMREYYPEVAGQMVEELDAQLATRLGFGPVTTRGLQWVIVTTPADINQMDKSTPLSRALTEELAKALTAKGYYVQEIRKTSEVVFSKTQGEFMLTRDTKALATKRFQSTLIVTGTYVPSPYGIRFNVEVMDARNNDVLAKSSRTLPMSTPVAYLHYSGDGNAVAPSVVTQPDWRTSRQKTPSFLLP
ncbi:hypothetical protein JCM15519_32810 [Fundidesulfovibrio butyratiphilus]